MDIKDLDAAELARLAANQYARNYRKEHPDKVKTWNQKYWAKKAKAMNLEDLQPKDPESTPAPAHKGYERKPWVTTY